MLEGERVTVISHLLFGITRSIQAHLFCDECFMKTEFFIHVKSAESISSNILFPFYVLEVQRVLFYVQSSLHDSVRVECFVCQVLMISVYTDLLTKEDVSEFLQNFNYGQ